MGKYSLNIFHITSATSSKSEQDLIYSIVDQWGDFTSELVEDYLNFKPVIRLTNYLEVKYHSLMSHLCIIRCIDITYFNDSLRSAASYLILRMIDI